MSKRIRNTDVDNWYNTTHTSIKLKKSTSEKFKTEITRDSRVFFLTLRRIKDEDIVNETITKAQIMKECPDISQKTVERALKELLDSNEIIKIGGGRYTSYTWNWEK